MIEQNSHFTAAPYLKQKEGKEGCSLYELLGDDMYKMCVVRDEVARNFKAFGTQNDLLSYIESVDQKKRCFHEIIFGQNAQRLKFDIDAPKEAMKAIDLSILPDEYRKGVKSKANAVINYIADSVVRLFNETYKQQLTNIGYEKGIRRNEHMMITESHGKDKFSFHIVVIKFNLPNNYEAGWFTEELCKSMPPPITDLVDSAVNKTIQNFRILGCSKSDSNRVKKIATEIISACDNGFIQGNKKDTMLISKFSKMNKHKNEAPEDQLIPPEVLEMCKDHMAERYPEFVFRDTSTCFLNFTRVASSHCDICERLHENDHTLVGIVSDNKLYRMCRRNQADPDKEKRERRLEMVFEDSAYDKCKALRQSIAEISDDYESLRQYRDTAKFYDKDRLRKLKTDYDTVFIKAPMKIGKTKALLEYVNKLPKDASICILSFRKTFSRQIMKMFKDFVAYNDFVGEITPKQYKRLIVQIESLHRIRDGVYDYVILDESESLIGQFGNADMKRKELAFANFELLIKFAKQVICMDAFMSSRTIESIRNMRKPKKEQISVNIHKNATDYHYEMGFCPNYTYNKMKNAIDEGKNIVIMANNRSILDSYRMMLEVDRPGLSMIDYTSKTDVGIKNTHMSNVNDHWIHYRVVLYTPTITAGISFEEAHFHKIFAIFTNTTSDVLSCMQMLGRIRNVLDKDITICYDLKYKRCSTTIEGIKMDLKYGNYELLSSTDNLGSPKAILKEDAIEYVYNDDCNYYKMWLMNELEKNNSKRSFPQHMAECIKQTGATISVYNDMTIAAPVGDGDDADGDGEVDGDGEADGDGSEPDIQPNVVEDVRQRIRDIRKVLSEENLLELANAPCIDRYERNQLLERQDDGDGLTVEESRALDKFALQRLYDVSDDVISSIEFLKMYAKEKVKNQYLNLKNILISKSMPDSLNIIKDHEKSKYDRIKESNTILLDQKFSTDKHHNVMNLLKISGFEHILDTHNVSKDYLMESYNKHENMIHRCCNIFKKPLPTVRANAKNKNIEDSLFDAKVKSVNKILNEWYSYKIDLNKKEKEDPSYRLLAKHHFRILSNNFDRELVPEDMPIIEYNLGED